MGIWEKANKIEELGYRVGNVRDMVELIAADLQDPHSGALWGVRDFLETIQNEIVQQSTDLMADVNEMRELRDQLEVLKAKKNKATKKK